MPDGQQSIDIERDPLRWRLDYKATLLADGLVPAILLEMSREGIRAIRSHAPGFERIQKYGDYHVPINELEDLEQAQAELKSDLTASRERPYEDFVDHVVDVQALMTRMTAAMERFNEDHKEQVASIEAQNSAKGCLLAGLFLTAGITTAVIAMRILA